MKSIVRGITKIRTAAINSTMMLVSSRYISFFMPLLSGSCFLTSLVLHAPAV